MIWGLLLLRRQNYLGPYISVERLFGPAVTVLKNAQFLEVEGDNYWGLFENWPDYLKIRNKRQIWTPFHEGTQFLDGLKYWRQIFFL